MAEKKRDDYVYTKLGDLKEPGVRFNIYGVVTQIVKHNVRGGKGYHSLYYITDESLKTHDPFRIHIFHQLSETIMKIDIGSILRLHRVKIEKWEDKVDGRVFSALDVVVFPAEDTGKEEFFSDATTVHYTEEVTKRVNELREMSRVNAICDAGMVETTASQRITFKVSGLPEKRKSSSPSDEAPPARSPRNDVDESKLKNLMINPACGQNRIFNPSKFKPHKKLLLNPMHDKFKKLSHKEESSDDDSMTSTSETCFASKGIEKRNSNTVNNKRMLQSNHQGRELCRGFEDNSVRKISSKPEEKVKATTSVAVLEENRRSPRKAKEHPAVVSPMRAESDVDLLQEKRRSPRKAKEHPSRKDEGLQESPSTRENGLVVKTCHSPTSIRNVHSCNSGNNGIEHNVSPDKMSVTLPQKLEVEANVPQSPCRRSSRIAKTDKNFNEPTLSPSAIEGKIKSETKSSPSLSKSSGWVSTESRPTFNRRRRKIIEAKVEVLSLVSKCVKNDSTAAVDQSHGKNLSEDEDDPQCVAVDDCGTHDVSPVNSENEREISSAFSLSHGLRETPKKSLIKTASSVGSANDGSVSMKNCGGSFASSKCPGLACATVECSQSGPVTLDDDDPRLAGFKEEDLEFEGLGDIPAADEDGNSVLCTSGYMSYGGDQEIIQTTSQKLVHFKWPRSRANVRIIKIKPSLKVLKTCGPRDLVSGKCSRCAAHSPYSLLKWNIDHVKRVKRPMCPVCDENGVCHYVTLEFRMKIKARDAWGTVLSVYAIKRDASKFLGCSLKDYQEKEESRKRVTKLLLEALSSKSYFNICVFRVNTLIKAQFYLCETSLPDVFLKENTN